MSILTLSNGLSQRQMDSKSIQAAFWAAFLTAKAALPENRAGKLAQSLEISKVLLSKS